MNDASCGSGLDAAKAFDSRAVAFADADAVQRALLGGKGASLAAMTQAGLPVSPGFVIPTSACRSYFGSEGDVDDRLWDRVDAALSRLEEEAS